MTEQRLSSEKYFAPDIRYLKTENANRYGDCLIIWWYMYMYILCRGWAYIIL